MGFVMNPPPSLSTEVDPLSSTPFAAALAGPVFAQVRNPAPGSAMAGFITLSMVILCPVRE